MKSSLCTQTVEGRITSAGNTTADIAAIAAGGHINIATCYKQCCMISIYHKHCGHACEPMHHKQDRRAGRQGARRIADTESIQVKE